jgi:hypothetical protein
MGKANQQRRAMKAKARRRAASGPAAGPTSGRPAGAQGRGGAFFSGTAGSSGTSGDPTGADLVADVRTQLFTALHHLAHGETRRYETVAHRITEPPAHLASTWRRVVERELGATVLDGLTRAWQGGWEPADVVRLLRRSPGTDHAHLARDAVAAEIGRYAPTTVAPRWHDQLAELGATVRWPSDRTWLRAEEHRPWEVTVRLALELADALARLPRLELLGPIPGKATHAPAVSRSDVDERILARVRALLAKAESTTFPAEAETFTAGAHALMARHRIDRALLDATRPTKADGPVGRRIGIDNPYEGPKAMLLDAVARASQCRTVWSKALGFSTVVGHIDDLDAVELLFTSLLLQATTAMSRQGSRQYAGGGSRTRSFRQSFLIAFGQRIGERLEDTTEEQTREAVAETGRADLLPVLAARRTAVDAATTAMFPGLVEKSVGGSYDREGWASGRAAADQASLQTATPLTS